MGLVKSYCNIDICVSGIKLTYPTLVNVERIAEMLGTIKKRHGWEFDHNQDVAVEIFNRLSDGKSFECEIKDGGIKLSSYLVSCCGTPYQEFDCESYLVMSARLHHSPTCLVAPMPINMPVNIVLDRVKRNDDLTEVVPYRIHEKCDLDDELSTESACYGVLNDELIPYEVE